MIRKRLHFICLNIFTLYFDSKMNNRKTYFRAIMFHYFIWLFSLFSFLLFIILLEIKIWNSAKDCWYVWWRWCEQKNGEDDSKSFVTDISVLSVINVPADLSKLATIRSINQLKIIHVISRVSEMLGTPNEEYREQFVSTWYSLISKILTILFDQPDIKLRLNWPLP